MLKLLKTGKNQSFKPIFLSTLESRKRLLSGIPSEAESSSMNGLAIDMFMYSSLPVWTTLKSFMNFIISGVPNLPLRICTWKIRTSSTAM